MLYIEMEEVVEQSDQPPPMVSIAGHAGDCHAWLETHISDALHFLQKPNSELSVRIVDDNEMSALHREHSGIAGATDVLTFDHGSTDQAIIADIAICEDVAIREAKNHTHSLQEELLLYIVHGILHCMGFDDHEDEAHKQMHEEEDRVLTAIGVGAIWSKIS